MGKSLREQADPPSGFACAAGLPTLAIHRKNGGLRFLPNAFEAGASHHKGLRDTFPCGRRGFYNRCAVWWGQMAPALVGHHSVKCQRQANHANTPPAPRAATGGPSASGAPAPLSWSTQWLPPAQSAPGMLALAVVGHEHEHLGPRGQEQFAEEHPRRPGAAQDVGPTRPGLPVEDQVLRVERLVRLRTATAILPARSPDAACAATWSANGSPLMRSTTTPARAKP